MRVQQQERPSPARGDRRVGVRRAARLASGQGRQGQRRVQQRRAGRQSPTPAVRPARPGTLPASQTGGSSGYLRVCNITDWSSRTRVRARAHTHTRAHKRTQHILSHTHAHTRAHTHTHTHTRPRTQCPVDFIATVSVHQQQQTSATTKRPLFQTNPQQQQQHPSNQ